MLELLLLAGGIGFVARLVTDWTPVPLGPQTGPGDAGKGPPTSPPAPTPPTPSAAPPGASDGGKGPRAVLTPRAATGAELGPASRVPGVANRIRDVWKELYGADIPPAALEIALAQAWLESGIADSSGGWWQDKTSKGAGNMTGSGNLGARQCGTGDKGGPTWDCVPYGDSRPPTPAEVAKGADPNKNITFPVDFRFYKAGTVGWKARSKDEAAAYDFVLSITKQWPAKAELESGDVYAYAAKQYANHYYGGFGATPEARIAGYVKAIADHLPAIAAALGQDKVNASVPANVITGAKAHATSAVAGLLGYDPDELDDQTAELELELLGAVHHVHPRHWLHLFPEIHVSHTYTSTA